MNNLIYSRTSNALQIYDNFMEYKKRQLSVNDKLSLNFYTY